MTTMTCILIALIALLVVSLAVLVLRELFRYTDDDDDQWGDPA